MCGIVGVVNLTNTAPVNGALLKEANALLLHRGPDGSGVFLTPEIGMAVRRLSIIDLAGGQQPMANEDGSVHVVYNGEIYNHAALRQELEAQGHLFRTRADTEVLVHGYEQWGRDGLLERLHGMFAFAIWDAKRHALFLARDRMGMKPLYFAEHDGRLYFSSEIRGVLQQANIPRSPNLDALGLYMRIGFVTSPHTMFEGIQKLPPANYLWIENGNLTTNEYWTLSFEPTNLDSEYAIVDTFRNRLQDSVQSHLMSEVPFGALLSGGVDSTTIVAMMVQFLDEPVKTFTVGFAGTGVDEVAWAEASAVALGTEHRAVAFAHDTMTDYPEVIRAQEEPFARPTDAALHHVFRACRELGLKVVITGEGADELLGGYRWHHRKLESWISRLPHAAYRLAGAGPRLTATGDSLRALWHKARGKQTNVWQRYADIIAIGKRDVAHSLLAPDVRRVIGTDIGQPIVDGWKSWLSHLHGQPEFGQVLWLQSRTRMADYINHGLDRQSMAHSVEARPPFLDHQLWEYCAAVPSVLKLRGTTEKYLLRQAGKNLVPEPARNRPKAALRVPWQPWIASPRLPDWAENALEIGQLRRKGLFDPLAVGRLRREVQQGDRSNVALLSAVLNLQAWSSIFLDAN